MPLHLDRVLLVEDDPSIVGMFVSNWPDWGWVLAANFLEAIQNIQRDSNNYDLIILDLKVPERDGSPDYTEGFNTLKRIHQASVAPIALCTGNDTEEYEKRADEFGVYGIIQKGSWVKNRIEQVIEGAIAKWKVHRYETATNILREERLKWRTGFLGNEKH
jgi:DNA-binding response OmpR family regulator